VALQNQKLSSLADKERVCMSSTCATTIGNVNIAFTK